jgi:recombination protein RecA
VYGPGAETAKRDVYGEKIKVSIWKTKVESKDAKHALAYFHTSNGRLVPEGFDRARDVLELAKSYSIIDVAGSWYSYNGKRLGQGENNVVVKLSEDHDLRNHIEEACRAEFVPEDVIPIGHDEGES